MPLLYTPPRVVSFSTGLHGVPTVISKPRFAGIPTVLSRPQFAGLGVAPAVAAGVVASGAAIGALIALIQNALDDDWTDSDVFKNSMQKIHSSMLALQCIVGGAQLGSPIVDTLGNTMCEGGTKPVCVLNDSQLKQWRTLRDSFGSFWADVQSFGSFMGPSSADAANAKQYARDFYAFYQSIQKTCEKQGTVLQDLPKPPVKSSEEPVPAWVKYTAWSIGGLAVIAIAVSAKSIFGKG